MKAMERVVVLHRNLDRAFDEMRTIEIIPNYTKHAEGSVLIKLGDTWVVCSATVEDKVPYHLKGTGEGFITAEYSMLPRATMVRNQRDVNKLRLSPRSAEIQRLIGRSLRSCVNLKKLGQRTITIDCDVLQADGGTRTAAITGGYVALMLALNRLAEKNVIKEVPFVRQVFAISGGMIKGCPMIDLCFEEDSVADVDMNVVMDSEGRLVEIQGTGEGDVFYLEDVNTIVEMANEAGTRILQAQENAIKEGMKR